MSNSGDLLRQKQTSPYGITLEFRSTEGIDFHER